MTNATKERKPNGKRPMLQNDPPAATAPTAEALAAQLKEEQSKRLDACGREVQAVLDKHGCTIVCNAWFERDGRLRQEPAIVLRPPNP